MYRFVAVVICVLSVSTAGADWLGFRGTHGNGVADCNAPTECDAESVVWSVELPGRGVSSPIVVGDQVIVTASSGVRQDRLHVISFDANTGDQRWHRQFWATGRTLCHPTSANAAPTAVSDGKNIVAFFSSNDVACFSLDGDLRWFRGLAHDNPKLGNDIGMASSPVIAGGAVVCQAESQGASFVEAMELTDGSTRWRIDRAQKSNWTSPVYLQDETADLVLLKSHEDVAAHDLQTGDQIWKVDAEVGGIPCMVVTKEHIYVPGATFLVLNRAEGSASVAWDSQKIKPSPSPLVNEERLLFINSAGVLNCLNSADGAVLWRVRVGGKYWASPIMSADGHIYTFNDAGLMTIVDAAGNKVASHSFDDSVMGTPAISNEAIFVRGVSRLWKLAQKP